MLQLADQNSQVDQGSEVAWSVKSVVIYIPACMCNPTSPFPGIPFHQLPVLEVDGKIVGQSMAIARYVARENDLAGKTNWDAAMADMYNDCIKDLIMSKGKTVPERIMLQEVPDICSTHIRSILSKMECCFRVHAVLPREGRGEEAGDQGEAREGDATRVRCQL